jgi:hypothetical protein
LIPGLHRAHPGPDLGLFTGALVKHGCPAEEVVTGTSSCKDYDDIVPMCRLWKSGTKPAVDE